jgi:hypothetical protein
VALLVIQMAGQSGTSLSTQTPGHCASERNVIFASSGRCRRGFLARARQELDLGDSNLQVEAGCALSVGPLILGERRFKPYVASLWLALGTYESGKPAAENVARKVDGAEKTR